MIRGVLRRADNRPVIPLIIGWDLRVQEVVALVDTGFSGEVKIPPKLVDELGLHITHAQAVLLANEGITEMPASLAFVSMEGIKEEVTVLICKGMAVVGVGLLKRFGYKLVIDFKYNSVTLEK